MHTCITELECLRVIAERPSEYVQIFHLIFTIFIFVILSAHWYLSRGPRSYTEIISL